MTSSDDHSLNMMPRPRFSERIETVSLHLPPGKSLGWVLSVTCSANGDMFILHQRDRTYYESDLPSVVHCNADGEFIDAWGGPAGAPSVEGVNQWPAGCEGIECDPEGNIWIFGWLAGDDAVLKYSPKGKLLARFGQRGRSGDDRDTRFLGCPTSCHLDVASREVFFSDGYTNHRVIAFNADTGEFTRMWGAYGKMPWELSPEEGFGTPVHKVAVGPDGHMYVCDRIKNRIQEFQLKPGGARFLREVVIAPGTIMCGSAFDIGFTPDGKFIYVGDGTNNRIWILDRESLRVLGWNNVDPTFEGDGNQAAMFGAFHRFFVQPSGDILLACVARGLRRMRFNGVR